MGNNVLCSSFLCFTFGCEGRCCCCWLSCVSVTREIRSARWLVVERDKTIRHLKQNLFVYIFTLFIKAAIARWIDRSAHDKNQNKNNKAEKRREEGLTFTWRHVTARATTRLLSLPLCSRARRNPSHIRADPRRLFRLV